MYQGTFEVYHVVFKGDASAASRVSGCCCWSRELLRRSPQSQPWSSQRVSVQMSCDGTKTINVLTRVTCTTAGLLCLLDEPESSLQSYALEQINSLIDTFWAEVADHVVKM